MNIYPSQMDTSDLAAMRLAAHVIAQAVKDAPSSQEARLWLDEAGLSRARQQSIAAFLEQDARHKRIVPQLYP